MKLSTRIQTTHTLELGETERFDITSSEGQVARVDQVYATNDGSGSWSVSLSGARVLKNGVLSKRVKVDTWWHSRRFSETARHSLFAAMSPEVQDELLKLGVKI